MSKITYGIIGFVLVTLVACGAYYFLHTNPAVVSVDDGKTILLYPESGDVSFKRPNDQVFVVATTSPTSIPNLTVVKTEKGKASVLLPDNSMISLDEDTQIVVNYTEAKVSIYQLFGKTYHRVETVIRGGSYQVETPKTVASVRGTKFGVFYNKETEETKVSVTEHAVSVSKIKLGGTATTTVEKEEEVVVEEGKTAKITRESIRAEIKDLLEDEEVKVWVETQKVRDQILDEVKKERASKTDVRADIKLRFFNDVNKESQREERRDVKQKENETRNEQAQETREDTVEAAKTERQDAKKEEVKQEESATQIKREEAKKADSKPEVKVETKVEVKAETKIEAVPPTRVIKKLGEDEFFGTFNDLFVKYFYVEDGNAICQTRVSATERVRLVTSYATESGYGFTSKTLLSFAEAIQAYCDKPDDVLKAKLQSRFEAEFPYNESF